MRPTPTLPGWGAGPPCPAAGGRSSRIRPGYGEMEGIGRNGEELTHKLTHDQTHLKDAEVLVGDVQGKEGAGMALVGISCKSRAGQNMKFGLREELHRIRTTKETTRWG